MPNSTVEEVWKAWNNYGPAPRYHELMQARLKEEWPTLYWALERLERN